VRVLGIETSSQRGTVALVEDGSVVSSMTHDTGTKHAEKMLPLVDAVLAAAGWSKSTLDRIAVGVGPGSFTGLRLGLALAQGIGLGLERPVLGIGSVHAMCRGVPDSMPGTRVALLDARRNDLFIAAYRGTQEIVAPQALARAAVAPFLGTLAEPLVVVGEVGTDLGLGRDVYRSEVTDLPHAICVAFLGSELSPDAAPAEPAYLREPDAIRPKLRQSPLSSREPT
jgi:tRNA threonylcarbamoyladenosine biosynthesis protein TsaB